MARIQSRPLHAGSASAPTLWERSGADAPAEESRLLMLAESVGHMGHWHWDIVTDKLTWSDQVFAIHGVDPATFPLSFAAALDTCHPDDRARVVQAFDESVETHKAFEFDCRIQRADGVRTIICKGQPEYDKAGAVSGLFGVLADVTDAFAAIRAIHDQKEMLGLAAHLAHLGHWIWSQDESRLALCSEEVARIHDLSSAEMARFTHPRQLAAAVVARDRTRYIETVEVALSAAAPYEIEYAIESAGGVRKDIREIGQPIVDELGKLRRFIATVQDISEAKRRENELARAEEELTRRSAELQESNRQKDKLFSIIAHDLRSPFNTVMGFSEILASSAKDLPREKVADYAALVFKSAGDVQTLLDNLLTWASMQIRSAGLTVQRLDLGDVAARSVEPLLGTAREKSVSVINEIVDVAAVGDADLICTVIRNLVSNGIKYCCAGGRVRLYAKTGPDFVTITVRDNGVGMGATAKAELFALKCATSQAGTMGEKGTGLGLYLCRDIVDRHGGEITVDSTPGSGTAIHFTLRAPR